MELIEQHVSALAAKLGSTPEVITKFLTDASASEEVKLDTLEVFTQDQLAQRIANESSAAALKAKNEATGNTYGAIDNRILKATGIAKNAEESTADYSERAYKEKFGKAGGNESEELQRLRSDIAAKDNLLTQKDSELQQVKVQHATEAKAASINAKLDSAINILPINTTPELLDSQREFLKFRLSQKYDIDVVDGKEQFTDKITKEVKRDQKTATPMTAATLVAEFAPTVVSLKADQSAKPGSGYKGSGNDFNKDGSARDYSQYTSKDEFVKDLQRQGIAPTGKEGSKLYDEFLKARTDLK